MIKKLVEKNDARVQRVLEIIPGALTWGLLLSPIWLGLISPTAFALLIAFLVVLWVYRALIHTVGVVVGYKKYQKELKVNWLKKVEEKPGFRDLKQLIVIPTVDDPSDIIEHTLGAIARAQYPKENLYIAYTIEEKHSERVLKDVEKIKAKYGRRLGTLWTFVHPAGLPGEAVGAASNRKWGARNAVKKIKELGMDPEEFVTTTFDGDARVHPQFLARLAYAYLEEPRPHNHFFQTALFLFDNNIWEVPPLMRIQANGITLAVLSSWVTDAHRKETFSCFSVSLKTLIDSDYWDTSLGVDDTPFFWRAFFARGGDFKGKTFYIPIYSDAVQGKTWLKAHVAQYKQFLRWGWGVVVFPMALKGFLTQKIPLSTKLDRTWYLIQQYTVWKTIAFMISFGFIILTLVNPSVRQTSLGYLLPKIINVLLSVAFVLLIPIGVFRSKIARPMPKDWSTWKKLRIYLEAPAVVINLILYNFIPYIDAETRLMIGKRLEFWTTPKVIRDG
jgi:hypothetical protein